VPGGPEDGIVSRFLKREELNLNAEGCQELAEDSFSSGVADPAAPAVSAISWCSRCEFLPGRVRGVGVGVKLVLVRSA